MFKYIYFLKQLHNCCKLHYNTYPACFFHTAFILLQIMAGRQSKKIVKLINEEPGVPAVASAIKQEKDIAGIQFFEKK